MIFRSNRTNEHMEHHGLPATPEGQLPDRVKPAPHRCNRLSVGATCYFSPIAWYSYMCTDQMGNFVYVDIRIFAHIPHMYLQYLLPSSQVGEAHIDNSIQSSWADQSGILVEWVRTK